MCSIFINTHRKLGMDRLINIEVTSEIYSVEDYILHPQSMQQKINTVNIILPWHLSTISSAYYSKTVMKNLYSAVLYQTTYHSQPNLIIVYKNKAKKPCNNYNKMDRSIRHALARDLSGQRKSQAAAGDAPLDRVGLSS